MSGWGAGFGATTAQPGGGNTGVAVLITDIEDAGTPTAFKVVYDSSGRMWYGNAASWVRVMQPTPIADPNGLQGAALNEIFSEQCLVTDLLGNVWRGNGSDGWVRIVFAPVADVASLPNPSDPPETFASGALCLTLELAVTYTWDGAWVLP